MPSSTGTQTFRGRRYYSENGNLERCGTVQNVLNRGVHLYDHRTRRTFLVGYDSLQPMTTAQMELHLSVPSYDDPHPQEIHKRRLEVRAARERAWTPPIEA